VGSVVGGIGSIPTSHSLARRGQAFNEPRGSSILSERAGQSDCTANGLVHEYDGARRRIVDTLKNKLSQKRLIQDDAAGQSERIVVCRQVQLATEDINHRG